MISAVIIAKNEESNIRDCISTLDFADEIIVVDDNSQDKTAGIAKSLGAKVFTRSLGGDFSKQRNFGMEKTEGDWILFVDADERVSETLASEILNSCFLPLNSYAGFYIRRKDFMWGRELKHGEAGRMKLLRLVKKSRGIWIGRVHEKWEAKGKIGQLKNHLVHYPHRSLAEFLKEINFYTDIRSKELFEQRKKCSLVSIILYPIGKFMLNYFFKLGIMDGIAGLVFAITMSFHSFLVRGKLWCLGTKNFQTE